MSLAISDVLKETFNNKTCINYYKCNNHFVYLFQLLLIMFETFSLP